jgi:uroporphyrinogen-III synthase
VVRLLVTRPEPDAGRTAVALRARGHEVLVQPLLAVSFAPPPADVPTPAAIAVTSQNGVRALGLWPQAAGWRDIPVFAAGPATARALADLGFGQVQTGAHDAGSLADAIIAGLPKGAGPLVYPAARDRSGALAERLAALGYDVRAVEAYRADPATRLDPSVRAALAAGQIDGVLLYSRRTAMTLRDLAASEGLTESLTVPTYYVISDQVGALIKGIAPHIHVAVHPDEDSLLALLPSP